VRWFSFPQNAFCAHGFPIGTNNCTISSWKLTKAITEACLFSAPDPNYPSGFTNQCGTASTYAQAAAHMVLAFSQCPDVKGTLPPPQ